MPSGPSSAPEPEPATTEALRRVDWRFLLPRPELDSVIVLGRGDPLLVAGLRAVARTVAIADESETDGSLASAGGASNELAVMVGSGAGSAEALRAAAAVVRPGGLLYAELANDLASRLRRFGRRPVALKVASASGWEGGRLYWHWPSFTAALEIGPIDQPKTLEIAGRRRSRWLGRAAARVAGAIGARGLLGPLVPAVSLVARRATAKGSMEDLAAQSVAPVRGWVERLAASGPLVLLTPRFRASRHVVGIALEPVLGHPAVVIKTPRALADDAGIRREADVLRELDGLPDAGGRPSVPRVAVCEAVDGRTVLIETALGGSLLGPRDLRAKQARTIESVVDWLVRLAGARAARNLDSQERPPGSATAAEIADRSLVQLGSALAASRDGRELVAQTRTFAAHVLRSAVKPVVEHGDCGPPNLLIAADGQVQVVDWESAELDGLPLRDLPFFLGWASATLADSRGLEDYVASASGAFVGRSSWAEQPVRRYVAALGLEPRLVPGLVCLAWARTVNDVLVRLGNDAPVGDALDEWLASNRHARVWRRCLQAADARLLLPDFT